MATLEFVLKSCIICGFVIPALDVLLGGIGTVLHIDFDFDADFAFDCPIIINVMSLCAFSITFGAFGLYFMRKWSVVPALIVAVALGFMIMWALSTLVLKPLKRNRSMACSNQDMLGAQGTVRVELRGDFTGSVTALSPTGVLISCNARPIAGISCISIGSEVKLITYESESGYYLARPVDKLDEQEG